MQTTIREFIVDNFLFGQPDGLTDSDSLLEKGVVDSTGVLELINFVEKLYGFKVADEEIIPDNFDSINRITEYVGRKHLC
ncbi:MAG TPA: acyl carrier protein [Bryobacteraceae bacterium]|nr:acyl carrier protein [Bryobacteraceae bacterium]